MRYCRTVCGKTCITVTFVMIHSRVSFEVLRAVRQPLSNSMSPMRLVRIPSAYKTLVHASISAKNYRAVARTEVNTPIIGTWRSTVIHLKKVWIKTGVTNDAPIQIMGPYVNCTKLVLCRQVIRLTERPLSVLTASLHTYLITLAGIL